MHSFTIAAGGTFTSPFSSLSVLPDASGNGGIISVSAANLGYNGPPLPPISFNLTANGSTAAGGVIVLQLSNKTAGISIGNGIGQYNIDASGANGGTVLVNSAGNLAVDMTSLKSNSAPNGAGSNVTLVAGKNLLVTGTIDTHNGATGTYGNVVLQSGSKDVFTVGGGSGTLNGIVGLTSGLGQGILGQNVTVVNNAGGLAVNSGLTVFSTANLLLKASGSAGGISIGGAISCSGTADLIASGKGTITETGATALLGAQTLRLVTDSGNVGASHTSPFVFSASNVSANTGKNGSVFLQNNTGMATIAASAVGGAFDYVGNDGVATNTDVLTVGNISAANGAITIASNAQSLILLPASAVNTTNGNITLQNTFLAGVSNPLISIGNNSTIHASAQAKNNTAAGNVYIVLGPLPLSSALQPGVVPTSQSRYQSLGQWSGHFWHHDKQTGQHYGNGKRYTEWSWSKFSIQHWCQPRLANCPGKFGRNHSRSTAVSGGRFAGDKLANTHTGTAIYKGPVAVTNCSSSPATAANPFSISAADSGAKYIYPKCVLPKLHLIKMHQRRLQRQKLSMDLLNSMVPVQRKRAVGQEIGRMMALTFRTRAKPIGKAGAKSWTKERC